MNTCPNSYRDEGSRQKQSISVGSDIPAEGKAVKTIDISNSGSGAAKGNLAATGFSGRSISSASSNVDTRDPSPSQITFEDTEDGIHIRDWKQVHSELPHSYENWPVTQSHSQSVGEVTRRGGGGGGIGCANSGRSIKRWKNRTSKLDRWQQQVLGPFQQGHQVQAQVAIQRSSKTKVPRPPLHASRKRRCCTGGKVPHMPESFMSEGDMNQADEMGEGVDEGFTEGAEMLKRRKRKQLQQQQLQQGGLHVLAPSISDGTPPSSPSGTPAARRRLSSRKTRPKPRSKKCVKQAVPASADISSTQETTTPGPGSSDTTDSPDDTEAQLNLAECEPEATTPVSSNVLAMDAKVQLPPAAASKIHSSGGMEMDYTTHLSARATVLHADFNVTKERGMPQSKSLLGAKPGSNVSCSNQFLQSNAPYSSGTSDVETSGNERVSESASDLSGLREEPNRSVNGCNSTSSGDEVFKGSRQGPKPPTSRKPPNLQHLSASKPTLSGPSRGLHHYSPSSPSLSTHSAVSPGGTSPEPVAAVGSALSPAPSKPKPPVAAKPTNLRQMSTASSTPNLKKVFTYDEQTKEAASCEGSDGISWTPVGVNGQTPTEHTPSRGTDGSPVENVSSPGEAIVRSGVAMEMKESKQSVLRKEMVTDNLPTANTQIASTLAVGDQHADAQGTDAQPLGAQHTGAQATETQALGAQHTGVTQESSAQLSQGVTKKPLLPKRTAVPGGSEGNVGTPVAELHHVTSFRTTHSPAPVFSLPGSSDTSSLSKPVPKPSVLGKKPVIPVKPKLLQVLSTVASKTQSSSLAEESSVVLSPVPVESEGKCTEPKLGFQVVLNSGTGSNSAEKDGSEPKAAVANRQGCKANSFKPVTQGGSDYEPAVRNGSLLALNENLSQKEELLAVQEGIGPVKPATPEPPLQVPNVFKAGKSEGETDRRSSCEGETDALESHTAPSQPRPAPSSSPIPTVDHREQSSPGEQSSPCSQDSGQELRVSPVPQKTATMRRSPHVGVCITPHSSPTPDLGVFSRKEKGHHSEMSCGPPPLLPARDNLAVGSNDVSFNPSFQQGPTEPTARQGEDPSARKSKSMKRFQLKEDENGCMVVPRAASASVSKRHYDEVVEFVTLPRKDITSKRTAPPKPPKTYTTDEATSSPTGTPPIGNSPTLGRSTNTSCTITSTATVALHHPAVECAPPPLPSAPIPRKKDRLNSHRRACDSPNSCSQRSSMSHLVHPLSRNEVASGSKSSLTSNEGSDPSLGEQEPYYDSIQSESTPGLDQVPTSYSPSHWLERYDVSDNFRKRWSGNFKHSVTTSDCASHSDGGVDRPASGSLHRTTSLDSINDRMQGADKILFKDTDESSDEGIISPAESTPVGLPEVPQTWDTPKTFDDVLHSDTYDEPLYQYINTAEFLTPEPHHSHRQSSPKTQLDIARHLAQRKLWCEQKEVMESGVLGVLSDEEKKLQEAMYEVIMSEATYLRSLDVLIEHFMDEPGMNPNLPEGRRVISKREHHVIFSNIRDVREASARFLADLHARQKESLVITNICDIILEHSKDKFDCYIPYCTNQIYQTRELQKLIESNVMFRDYLKRLESHKRCQNLSMQSFLLLPMQRITRLPLLILAIFNRTPSTHPEYDLVERCLRTIQKLVTQCNDGARKLERTEQLHDIYRQMVFTKLKPFPLVSVSRQLERKGPLIRLKVEQTLFGKVKIKKKQLFVFSFTDFIFITKRKTSPKGESAYTVKDHASRAVIEVKDLECRPGVTYPKHTFGEQTTVAQATWAVSTANVSDAFLVILLDNAYHKCEKYIFVAQNSTDKTRWMESIQRPHNEGEEEKIYQHWDCPQVQALYDYHSEQPDELSLERGDIVKVLRKMADGWYEGERLRDGQWGWFPSNFTTEIHSEHTRARNLRETHKLLSVPLTPEEFTAQIQNMT